MSVATREAFRGYHTPIADPNTELSPQYSAELPIILNLIPRIEDEQRLDTEKVYEVVEEKPFAIDLADELRKTRQLTIEGRDPEVYWDFFRSQAEYYANESYAKLGAIEFRHDLVNDFGRLKMWIDPMGKGAHESYSEAAEKVSSNPKLEWYKDRCQTEADAILQWEELLMKHGSGRSLIDISPAPFEVPDEYLEGTMFGTHSFIRLHQLVYDEETGVPYVFSRAHRTHLPPEELEKAFEIFTGDKVNWRQLLGTFAPIHESLKISDIREQDIAISVERIIEKMERKSGIPEPVSTQRTKEDMRRHYEVLLPALRQVFDQMVTDRSSGESEDAFLQRLVLGFQTWEKMLVGRLNGEWGQIEAGMDSGANQPNVDNTQKLQEMYYFYQQQEYRPQANGCGTGSGASSTWTESSLSTPSYGVLFGTSSVLSGVMNTEGLSLSSNQKKYKFDNEGTCNECGKSHKIVGLLGPCLVCRSCQIEYDAGRKK